MDYAAPAIPLARAVAEAAGQPGLQFAVADLLAPFPPPPGGAPSFLAAGCADLLVDKGTLDAVGLSAGGAGARRRYAWAAARLLSPRGLLVLTSCNSTADELADEFCCAEAGWAEVGRVRTYPTFSFGGRTGARVATLALRRPAGGDDAA